MNKELRSEIAPREPATQPFRVVLHESHKPGEWVTHVECLTENIGPGGYKSKDRPDYNWGHYFPDYAEAVKDYKKRCDKYLLGYNMEA